MPNGELTCTDERFLHAAEAFEKPRFYAIYRRWLRSGERAFDEASSTVIRDALASGIGRVESIVLPHRYDHLSPLVDIVGPAARGAEKGAEKREQWGDEPVTPTRPPFDSPLSGDIEVRAREASDDRPSATA
jgi:hypothetical protein